MKRWWARWRSHKPPQQTPKFSLGERLKFDVHSHLLPGVDDGASNLDTSLELLSKLVEMGYQGAVLTPHIYPGLYNNSRATLEGPFATLQSAAAEKFPGFSLHLAAEYFVDEQFMDAIQRNDLLHFPVLDQRAVLFEMGFQQLAPQVFDAIFELQLSGYQPVLAHVERYPYLVKDAATVYRFQERGVWLTINAASLAGAYGPEVKNFAADLMQRGWARMLCSDAHGIRHMHALGSLQTDADLGQALKRSDQWVQTHIPS
jgi:protein-tyrosine phosphatase